MSRGDPRGVDTPSFWRWVAIGWSVPVSVAVLCLIGINTAIWAMRQTTEAMGYEAGLAVVTASLIVISARFWKSSYQRMRQEKGKLAVAAPALALLAYMCTNYLLLAAVIETRLLTQYLGGVIVGIPAVDAVPGGGPADAAIRTVQVTTYVTVVAELLHRGLSAVAEYQN